MSYETELLTSLKNVTIISQNNQKADLKQLKQIFKDVKSAGGKIYFIGNGGSAGIAEHMTADYLKNGKMKAVSMFAAPTLTCLGNDFGYENVFSKQLEIYADKDDLLVAISSSGNSPNIVNAIFFAQKVGMKILTFSGFDSENKISHAGDYNLHVPSHEYGIVESIHNLILQRIVDEIKSEEVK